MRNRCLLAVLLCLFLCTAVISQTTTPRLVKFSGSIPNGQGTVGVTFALYAQETGGTPLWLETQNVSADEKGRFTILLGAQHTDGVPVDLFSSGQANWLGVQAQGQAEQARVLLVWVPYALAAGDAQTLGGKPLSSFMLAPDNTTSTPALHGATEAPAALAGNTNYVAKFTANGRYLINSSIFDTGSGVGIGTTAPGQKLEVKGSIKISTGSGGGLIFADGTAQTTAAAGGVGSFVNRTGDSMRAP